MNQPLAYVHPGAKIAKNVVIEPFATINNNVIIGEGTWVGSNVIIMEGARIGKNCSIFPGSVISAIPQDLKFNGEDSLVVINDNTTTAIARYVLSRNFVCFQCLYNQEAVTSLPTSSTEPMITTGQNAPGNIVASPITE